MLLGGSVCEGRGGDRSVGVVGLGWVCWMGGVCGQIMGEGGAEGAVLDCMGQGVGGVGGM